MDEAEYCGRLGIMSAGRLLAMDSPAALKRDILPGPAWNLVVVDRLIPALEALEQIPGVFQVGLRGDHLHAITLAGQHTGGVLAVGPGGIGLQRPRSSRPTRPWKTSLWRWPDERPDSRLLPAYEPRRYRPWFCTCASRNQRNLSRSRETSISRSLVSMSSCCSAWSTASRVLAATAA